MAHSQARKPLNPAPDLAPLELERTKTKETENPRYEENMAAQNVMVATDDTTLKDWTEILREPKILEPRPKPFYTYSQSLASNHLVPIKIEKS
jgi:hypothetical protein